MFKAVRKIIDSIFRASFIKRLTSINLTCNYFDFSVTLWRLVFYCSRKFISNGRLIRFFGLLVREETIFGSGVILE